MSRAAPASDDAVVVRAATVMGLVWLGDALIYVVLPLLYDVLAVAIAAAVLVRHMAAENRAYRIRGVRRSGRRAVGFDIMQYPVRTRQWTRAEYDRLIEIGIFRPGDPVELLGGDLVVAEPQSGPHYTAIYLAEEALRRVFGPGWLVRTQAPIALDDESEPEPDVAVAQGPPREFSREHPARPVLVVEVAVSSLSFDRDYKGSLYARAQLQDYWIVNLADRVLEIYRQPVADAAATFGWRYASTLVLDPEAAVTPLAAPGTVVAVADLLP